MVLFFLSFLAPRVLGAPGGKPQGNGNVMRAKITVYEDKRVKRVDRALLGYNFNWFNYQDVMDKDPNSLKISKGFLRLFKGFPMPLNRMSGTPSQTFKWKWSIGPLSERKPQKLVPWSGKAKTRMGIVEWIKSVQAIDPKAKFTWTLNLTKDTPQDAADLAEFLTGDGKSNPNGGVNWAKKRIEYGIKKPVDVAIWELGNELDWKDHNRRNFPTVSVYTKVCRKVIAAIKKVDPKAKFAANSATTPEDKSYNKYGGWEVWHRGVLRDIGNKIDYIAFHAYYYGYPPVKLEGFMNVIRRDAIRILGRKKSDKLKFYVSEHARWPDSLPDKSKWYSTHALKGCLATGQWLNRMLSRKDVAAAAYHSFMSGPWGLFYYDEAKKRFYKTGIADLFEVLNDAYKEGRNVVRVRISGKLTDVTKAGYTLSTAVMTTRRGLNIILVNREPNKKRKIAFEFQKKYRLVKVTTLTAKSMESYNTVDRKEIKVSSKKIKSKEDFKSYLMPEKSLAVLYLKRK